MTAKRLPGIAVAVIGVDTLQNVEFKMPKEAVDGLIKQFETDFKGAVGEGFMGAMFAESSDPQAKKLVCTKAETQDQKMAIALIHDMFSLDQTKLLKEAGVPVRCINSGGGYRFHSPTNIDGNKKYCDFDAVMIDDVGHYPMLEKPDAFNAALKKTLTELPKKS